MPLFSGDLAIRRFEWPWTADGYLWVPASPYEHTAVIKSGSWENAPSILVIRGGSGNSGYANPIPARSPRRPQRFSRFPYKRLAGQDQLSPMVIQRGPAKGMLVIPWFEFGFMARHSRTLRLQSPAVKPCTGGGRDGSAPQHAAGRRGRGMVWVFYIIGSRLELHVRALR